jgi:hypothetical protein
MNAHHVIPGNAAFKQSKALHKWIAETVTVKKVFSPDVLKPGMKIGHSYQGKFNNPLWDADPTLQIVQDVSQTKGGKPKVTELTSTSGGQVNGKVEFDINDAFNGIWLPGNDAVYDWSKHPDMHQEYAPTRGVWAGQLGEPTAHAEAPRQTQPGSCSPA